VLGPWCTRVARTVVVMGARIGPVIPQVVRPQGRQLIRHDDPRRVGVSPPPQVVDLTSTYDDLRPVVDLSLRRDSTLICLVVRFIHFEVLLCLQEGATGIVHQGLQRRNDHQMLKVPCARLPTVHQEHCGHMEQR
jgi:hypothetical protein